MSWLKRFNLFLGPVVSALTNKYGCRAVCMAGSFLGAAAFVLSTFSTSVNMLMMTYGVMGGAYNILDYNLIYLFTFRLCYNNYAVSGVGFGLIYLPAVVCVGYYFETKRSLATGIAVCGSGFGTFAFPPLVTMLLEAYNWKGANLILAGLILNCAVSVAISFLRHLGT